MVVGDRRWSSQWSSLVVAVVVVGGHSGRHWWSQWWSLVVMVGVGGRWLVDGVVPGGRRYVTSKVTYHVTSKVTSCHFQSDLSCHFQSDLSCHLLCHLSLTTSLRGTLHQRLDQWSHWRD